MTFTLLIILSIHTIRISFWPMLVQPDFLVAYSPPLFQPDKKYNNFLHVEGTTKVEETWREKGISAGSCSSDECVLSSC